MVPAHQVRTANPEPRESDGPRQAPIFQMTSNRIACFSKRQEVLAQNVANADTPAITPAI